MALPCPTCGQANPDGAQLCEFCKAVLRRSASSSGLRPRPPPPSERAGAGWSTPLVVLVALGGVALGYLLRPGTPRGLTPPTAWVAPAPEAEAPAPAPGPAATGDQGAARATPGAVDAGLALAPAADAGRPPGPSERSPTLAELTTPPEDPTAGPKVMRVPYRHQEGSAQRIIIPVTFNGSVTVPMALDTGAPGLIISSPLAQRLGLLQPNGGRLVTFARGIGGQRAAVLVIVDSLAVDEAHSEFVPATVVEPMSEAFEGLVGMDFLVDYHLEIDTREHVLVLTAQEPRSDAPGGRDERWWRETFRYFAQERARWTSLHEQLERGLSHAEAPSGMTMTQAQEFSTFAASQRREVEVLADRLERRASAKSVPREWRSQ